ncbi:MAG: hypothetical protein QNM02_18710, partial [Acidimicrobiia bacterium]|nr:hypothetical protein [Acidimicrobiia bacterium]
GATTVAGGVETTVAGGVETTVAGGVETTVAGGVETTVAAGPDTTNQSGCNTGERSVDGTCEPVEPVRLLLIDNVLECDGHGIARFAAVNDNPFSLDADTLTSALSPQRLDGEQVTVLERRDEASDDDALAAEFLTVRYITSVTWTVTHDGLETVVSAGVSGATPNPACPLAAVNATGADGVLNAQGAIPTTGPNEVLPISLIASLLLLAGFVLVVAAGRRGPGDEHAEGA